MVRSSNLSKLRRLHSNPSDASDATASTVDLTNEPIGNHGYGRRLVRELKERARQLMSENPESVHHPWDDIETNAAASSSGGNPARRMLPTDYPDIAETASWTPTIDAVGESPMKRGKTEVPSSPSLFIDSTPPRDSPPLYSV